MDQYIYDRVRSSFPQECDSALYRAVQEGVVLADDAIESNAFLSTLVGKDIRGHLRRAGIMFAVKAYAKRGDLPFEVTFKRQPRGCWHWASIKSKNVEAHIVRTDTKLAFPADSPNRQDKRIFNNGDLFDDEKIVPFSEVLGVDSLIYTWLACGADSKGEVTHVMWNTPYADEKKWLANIDVMESASKVRMLPSAKSPAPDLKSKMSFRDHIKKSIDDAGASDNDSQVE